MTREEINEKQKKYVFSSVANYYREPIVMASGKGQYLYDIDGREYLDFFGGILTVSVGHAHPRVTARITEQVSKLVHVSTLYQTENMVAYAEKLAGITPGRLQKSFFTNSGTEANETAVLLAELHTQCSEVVALRHGYSGRSMLAMTLTAHSGWRLGGTHLAGIKHALSGYCYRCPCGLTYPGCDLKCARDLEELILTTTSGRIAGLIAEPIQGVGGFITPPKEYFQVLETIVRKYGGIMIIDEVQTAWGRTGTMFGIEHWGIQPDIMTFAKGAANGLPIGVTIATPEVADSVSGPTISTFGGNPVTMAAALATLEVIEEEDLVANCKITGAYLQEKLTALQEKYPVIGEVRGMGLMQGLELVGANKEPAAAVVLELFEETRKRGLLVGKGGLYNNVVRITPPLTVGKADVDTAVDILDKSLAVVVNKLAV
ncbi:MAG TPA: aspartate aminotransferase family protein [Spirochaetia bacterium]|nr:aspartate aminotransferase family protein [Spirochaetia bacterium]